MTNEDLKRIAESVEEAQKALKSIPESAFRNISFAQNILHSFSIDYFKEFREQQKAMTEAFARVKTPDFRITIPDFTREMKQMHDALAESSEAMKKFRDSMIESSLGAVETFKRANEMVREASQILFQLGWWIYPDWTFPSLRQIIDAHKEGKDKEIEQEILTYFDDKKLDEMMQGWKANPKLAARLKGLEQALGAHKRREYILSVRGLLPDVEGIINENSGKTGSISHKQCIIILKDYVNKKVKAGPVSVFYPLAVITFVESLLTEKFEWGKPSNKGRNPILHGHHVAYDDHAFSLKLILLIDYIQHLI